VRLLLRLEGLAVLAGAVAGYALLHGSWLWFAVFFLTPDLSMLGYFAGPRIGAAAYNTGHSYIGPALIIAAWLVTRTPLLEFVALIWIAHIGFDRALGYGLKYAKGFGWTHLGPIGKARQAAA